MNRFLKNLDLSKIKGNAANKSRKSRKQKQHSSLCSFPCKLHKILTDSEKNDNESIVSWQPNGKSFRVYNQEKFVEIILPLYFRQTKYKSFQRQLNIYGFRRIDDGPLEGSYYHKRFLRGRYDLCKEVLRQQPSPAGIGEDIGDLTLNRIAFDS